MSSPRTACLTSLVWVDSEKQHKTFFVFFCTLLVFAQFKISPPPRLKLCIFHSFELLKLLMPALRFPSVPSSSCWLISSVLLPLPAYTFFTAYSQSFFYHWTLRVFSDDDSIWGTFGLTDLINCLPSTCHHAVQLRQQSPLLSGVLCIKL